MVTRSPMLHTWLVSPTGHTSPAPFAVFLASHHALSSRTAGAHARCPDSCTQAAGSRLAIPSAAKVVIHTWTRSRKNRAMERSLGRALFAGSLAGLGVLSLLSGDFALNWQPVPPWFPFREYVARVSGLVL